MYHIKAGSSLEKAALVEVYRLFGVRRGFLLLVPMLLFGLGKFSWLKSIEVRRFEIVDLWRMFLFGLAVDFLAHLHEFACAEVLQSQHLV